MRTRIPVSQIEIFAQTKLCGMRHLHNLDDRQAIRLGNQAMDDARAVWLTLDEEQQTAALQRFWELLGIDIDARVQRRKKLRVMGATVEALRDAEWRHALKREREPAEAKGTEADRKAEILAALARQDVEFWIRVRHLSAADLLSECCPRCGAVSTRAADWVLTLSTGWCADCSIDQAENGWDDEERGSV